MEKFRIFIFFFCLPPALREIIKEIITEISNYLSASLPGRRDIIKDIINYFPLASPAGGKSLRSGGPRPPRTPSFAPAYRPVIGSIINYFSAGLPGRREIIKNSGCRLCAPIADDIWGVPASFLFSLKFSLRSWLLSSLFFRWPPRPAGNHS